MLVLASEAVITGDVIGIPNDKIKYMVYAVLPIYLDEKKKSQFTIGDQVKLVEITDMYGISRGEQTLYGIIDDISDKKLSDINATLITTPDPNPNSRITCFANTVLPVYHDSRENKENPVTIGSKVQIQLVYDRELAEHSYSLIKIKNN
jgi:hypothetical protein